MSNRSNNFKQGEAGHTFVRKYIQHLLAHGVVSNELNKAEDFVEGGDSLVIYHRLGDTVDQEQHLLDGIEELDGLSGRRVESIWRGGLEVKTINNFIFRNNDMNEPTGTLQFELWSSEERMRLGWLPAMLYPEIRVEDDNPNSFI